jgi:hypothetical protein
LGGLLLGHNKESLKIMAGSYRNVVLFWAIVHESQGVDAINRPVAKPADAPLLSASSL